MATKEKEFIKHTPEDRLIWFHLDWAVNMRNEFGTREGNTELIEPCEASNPDDASTIIVEAVWKERRHLQYANVQED
jgi:hypothetical protein